MDKVLFSSDKMCWLTPEKLLNKLVYPIGEITLDPCSNRNKNVKALNYYFEDGLSLPWDGFVFMNPPYGRELIQWTQKLIKEHIEGNIETSLSLLPARTDTRWFHEMIGKLQGLEKYTKVCFLKGRIHFGLEGNEATTSAPFPSVLIFHSNNFIKSTIFTTLAQNEGFVWHVK